MRRAIRRIAIVIALVALLALVTAGGIVLYLFNTVARPSGALTVAGLAAPAEIVRDGEGVPHVFARSREDLAFALGFVHAQDRLWQMELLRRAGQGRLSEIFGERTYALDVLLRTLDLYGHAERSLVALPPSAQHQLAAYAPSPGAPRTPLSSPS